MITEQQKIEIDNILQESKDKQKWAEGQSKILEARIITIEKDM